MNRIIILGGNGMLGQMVYNYFLKLKYEVFVINTRFESGNFDEFINEINTIESGVVINCIGVIKQKSNETSDLLWGNSILPLELARSLRQDHVLIQPSTDCVFNGKSSKPYLKDHKCDAVDIYGWSKSLAETAVINRGNSLVIRVSIIGPDKNSKKGLLSWFLNNHSQAHINGFINHYWNGITTLEWCKKLRDFIDSGILFSEMNKGKLIQLGTTQIYTKFEMLLMFQETFKTDFNISPFEADESIYRCLSPSIISSSLKLQLEELLEYIDCGKI